AAIVSLYEKLLLIHPSPIVALNRAIAVGMRDGPEAGLAAIETMAGAGRLAAYPFHAAARGEFELRRGNREPARDHFRMPLALARSPMERRYFYRRVSACDPYGPRAMPGDPLWSPELDALAAGAGAEPPEDREEEHAAAAASTPLARLPSAP